MESLRVHRVGGFYYGMKSLTHLWRVTKCPQMQPLARSRMSRNNRALLVFVPLLLSASSVNAVLFYSTGDPNYNTSAPTGSLTNSGWQYQGIWGDFLGTPIAPKYFITAQHVGGVIGQTFNFRGVQYTTTAAYDDPSSDLRIWRICGTFPDYAPLYTKSTEVNKSFVVFGRGTQRSSPVTTTNLVGTVKTNGWFWGPSDAVVRWGENDVAGVITDNTVGDLLQATFDANGGVNECHLSGGDSAGGLFIKDGPDWKLAGINYSVDGPYSTTNSDAESFATGVAIFDGVGLYEKSVEGIWVPATGPGSFYASRVSAHLSWITSVINADIPPVLQSSTNADAGYADEANATVDTASNTITVAAPDGSRFYRLRACDPMTITTVRVQGGNLVFNYQ